MTPPIVIEASCRLKEASAVPGLHPEIQDVLARSGAWLDLHDDLPAVIQSRIMALANALIKRSSWRDFMSQLDSFYPIDMFGTGSQDSGPRILHLIRIIDGQRAQIDQMNEMIAWLRESIPPSPRPRKRHRTVKAEK